MVARTTLTRPSGRAVARDGVLGEPAGLGNHVAVEEHEDVMRGRAGTVAACPRQTEAPVVLVDDRDVQGRFRLFQRRRLRTVIDDDDLEQIPGIGLPSSPAKVRASLVGASK